MKRKIINRKEEEVKWRIDSQYSKTTKGKSKIYREKKNNVDFMGFKFLLHKPKILLYFGTFM